MLKIVFESLSGYLFKPIFEMVNILKLYNCSKNWKAEFIKFKILSWVVDFKL